MGLHIPRLCNLTSYDTPTIMYPRFWVVQSDIRMTSPYMLPRFWVIASLAVGRGSRILGP